MNIPTIRKLPSGAYTCQLRVKGRSISITDFNRDIVQAKAYAIKTGIIKAKNKPKELSIGEAVDQYIKDRSNILSPSTVREYIRCRGTDISDISHVKTSAVTSQFLQRWVNHFAASHSPKTTANAYRLLFAALNAANVDKSDLKVQLPPKQKPTLYAPTESDITSIIKAAQGTDMEIPILLAAFGSLRRSEICALRKSDITETGVYVTKAMVQNSNKEWVIKAPKTSSSHRHAELPPSVISRLKEISGDKITDLTPTAITKRFPQILKAAGVPSFRFHDLRHYWVSVAHAMGMPDYYIMKNGGWSTMDTPRKIYMNDMSELVGNSKSKAIDKFESQVKLASK